LEIVDDIRGRINRAANLLSGHLAKLNTKDNASTLENKKHIQRIKREIRTILTQLARLSDLSKKSMKNTINRLSDIGIPFTMYQSALTFCQNIRSIELWASSALTLTTGIDITKWPLEIQAGIKAKIGNWINVYLGGKTERPP